MANSEDRSPTNLDKASGIPATGLSQTDFTLVLSRMIASLKDDPSQLRNAIYEFARVKLQQMAWDRSPPLSVLETRRLMLALETAIERIETASSQHDPSHLRQPVSPLVDAPPDDSRAGNPAGAGLLVAPTLRPTPTIDGHYSIVRPAAAERQPRPSAWKQLRSGVAPVLRMSAVVVSVLILSVALNWQNILPRFFVDDTTSSPQTSDIPVANSVASPPTTAGQPRSSPLPLPEVYGVYAVSNGQRYELEPLTGRVPNEKVFMSTPITAASRTVLPDGRISFIIYRRDVAANAPERAAVRVIAKVARTMTFKPGAAASTSAVEDQWAIRNISFDFRVAPVVENSEMLMIRHENAEFTLPAGRYGLVLRGLAYDFVVAGSITEPSQCLERIEAANGTFYSECKPS